MEAPTPLLTLKLNQRIMDTVLKPTVEGLKKAGTPYVGFLYAGLMISPAGEPKVLEFNCRLGDPETQPILFSLAKFINLVMLVGSISMFLVFDSAAVPALPLATKTWVTLFESAAFQHRACSRPPLPTIRIFMTLPFNV